MSNKYLIRLIFISLLFTGGMVGFLYATMYKPNSLKNGFKRKVPAPNLTPVTLKLSNGYYFAGTTDTHIYLGNINYPNKILVISADLQDSSTVQIRHQYPKLKVNLRSMRILVDSPHVYQAEGITPIILRGELPHPYMDTILPSKPYFTKAVSLGGNTFVLRSVTATNRINTFYRIYDRPPYYEQHNGILVKQADGVFDTDGLLKYDQPGKRVIYSYFYRNEIVLMDTALKVLDKMHTLDSNTTAKIQIDAIGEGRYKVSAPPLTIKPTFAVYKDYLIVRSTLLADNEHTHELNKKCVFDLYSLQTHRYIRSFYIQKVNNEGPFDMEVSNENLYLLYQGAISVLPVKAIMSDKVFSIAIDQWQPKN